MPTRLTPGNKLAGMSDRQEDQIKNLVFENHQLRSELKVMQKTYGRLTEEKTELLKSLEDANELVSRLKEELAIRERMHQELREAKEKEIAELVKIKSDLELRLQSALDLDRTGVLDLDNSLHLSRSFSSSQVWWSQRVSHPQLSLSEAVETLSHWEGAEETIVQLQEQLNREQGSVHIHWQEGTTLTSGWKSALKIYLSFPQTLQPSLDQFLQNYFPQLEAICRNGGSSISTINISAQDATLYSITDESVTDVCLKEIGQCDIFVGILGGEAEDFLKLEVEHGFLNSPSSRPSLFLFLQSSPEKTTSLKLKQRIKRASEAVIILERKDCCDQVLQELTEEITKILRKHFDIVEPEHGNQDAMFEHLSLVSDVNLEYEQASFMQTLLSNAPQSLVGSEVTFGHIRDYLAEEGPVGPLLITSRSGFGKSTLLAKWAEHLERQSNETVVIYHFISHPCSSSSEMCFIYRRLIQKMLRVCGENTVPMPCLLKKLEECFAMCLEKVSAKLSAPEQKLLFILIDNVELISEPDCLSWILKPLPLNVKVILTASERAEIPGTWRSLPTRSIPSLTATDTNEVIAGVRYGPRNRTLTEDQATALALCSPSNATQLWCVLAAKHILSCSEGLSDDEVDELIESLTDYCDVSELALFSVNKFEERHSAFSEVMGQLLQLVYWARNGLYLAELKQLLPPMPDVALAFVIDELEKRQIISHIGGLICFTNEDVQEVVQIKYCPDPSQQMELWSQPLIQLFSILSEQLLRRCADELPWLLRRIEQLEDLLSILLNVDFLIQFYCSGQVAMLMKYWKALGIENSAIASYHYQDLETMEEQASDDRESLMYVATLMGTVGKIMRNMGLYSEAQPLLQRCLELHESHDDPDSSSTAQAMFELATLYTQDERYSAAESFYKQSLEVFEVSCGEESEKALKVLEALSMLYLRMERHELVDTVTTRKFAIMERRKKMKPTASSVLRLRVMKLEEELPKESTNPTPRLIHVANELGVLYSCFGDKELAEDNLLDALRSGGAVYGENHPSNIPLLKNLASLYAQTSRYDLSAALYEKIVEILGQQQPLPCAKLLDGLNQLASFYQEQERMKDTIAVHRRMISVREEEYGIDHTSVAASLNNLGVILSMAGDYQEAVKVHERALGIYREKYDRSHPLVQETIRKKELAMNLM